MRVSKYSCFRLRCQLFYTLKIILVVLQLLNTVISQILFTSNSSHSFHTLFLTSIIQNSVSLHFLCFFFFKLFNKPINVCSELSRTVHCHVPRHANSFSQIQQTLLHLQKQFKSEKGRSRQQN